MERHGIDVEVVSQLVADDARAVRRVNEDNAPRLGIRVGSERRGTEVDSSAR